EQVHTANPGSGGGKASGFVGLGFFFEAGGRPWPRRPGGGSLAVVLGGGGSGGGGGGVMLGLFGSGVVRTDALNSITSAGLLSRPLALVSAPKSMRIRMRSCSDASFGPLPLNESRTLALSILCFADCLVSDIISFKMSGAFVMCCCDRSLLK